MRTCDSCRATLPEDPYRGRPVPAGPPSEPEAPSKQEPEDPPRWARVLAPVLRFVGHLIVGSLVIVALLLAGHVGWWLIKTVVFKGVYHVGYYVGTSWCGWEMYARGEGTLWTWIFGVICLAVPFAVAWFGRKIMED